MEESLATRVFPVPVDDGDGLLRICTFPPVEMCWKTSQSSARCGTDTDRPARLLSPQANRLARSCAAGTGGPPTRALCFAQGRDLLAQIPTAHLQPRPLHGEPELPLGSGCEVAWLPHTPAHRGRAKPAAFRSFALPRDRNPRSGIPVLRKSIRLGDDADVRLRLFPAFGPELLRLVVRDRAGDDD